MHGMDDSSGGNSPTTIEALSYFCMWSLLITYVANSFLHMLHWVTWSCFSSNRCPLLQRTRCLLKDWEAFLPEKELPHSSQILWEASWLEQQARVWNDKHMHISPIMWTMTLRSYIKLLTTVLARKFGWPCLNRFSLLMLLLLLLLLLFGRVSWSMIWGF